MLKLELYQSKNFAYHPAALGSSPKHTIYAFIIYGQICAMFVSSKEQNKQNEAGFGPFLKNGSLVNLPTYQSIDRPQE